MRCDGSVEDPERASSRGEVRCHLSRGEMDRKVWWRRGGERAEAAGAGAVTRRRDRANPVCDWRRASGGGRSGDASQGQAEAHMAWADAMPRPEQLGVLRPSAGGGDDDGARDAERPSEDGGA